MTGHDSACQACGDKEPGIRYPVLENLPALAQTPAEVLRHIGSPFAPDKETSVPLLPAA